MLILHGDNTEDSYKKLIFITDAKRSTGQNVIFKDAIDLDVTYLRQYSTGEDLFGNRPCLVIKNLLSGQKNKQKELLIATLKPLDVSDIILYESKKVTQTVLNAFPRAKIETFSINIVIFKFLDILRPNNTQTLITAWNRLLELKHEPEYVFAMIVRQIRLLIQAKSGPSYLSLSTYPKKMIITQSTSFDLPHLLDLHHLLLQIDKKIKIGTSSLPLEQLVLQFLLKV